MDDLLREIQNLSDAKLKGVQDTLNARIDAMSITITNLKLRLDEESRNKRTLGLFVLSTAISIIIGTTAIIIAIKY